MEVAEKLVSGYANAGPEIFAGIPPTPPKSDEVLGLVGRWEEKG